MIDIEIDFGNSGYKVKVQAEIKQLSDDTWHVHTGVEGGNQDGVVDGFGPEVWDALEDFKVNFMKR